MTTFQFWALFSALVLIFLTLQAVHSAVKSLWTKLHVFQEMIGHRPAPDYREDLERLGRQLERIENSIDAQSPRSSEIE